MCMDNETYRWVTFYNICIFQTDVHLSQNVNSVVVKHLFQWKWFDRWSWPHEDEDFAFYFLCVVAY